MTESLYEHGRIHDLEILLNDVIVHEASFESYRTACQRITDYYMEERYPFLVRSELTEDEIKVSLELAEQLIAIIKTLVE